MNGHAPPLTRSQPRLTAPSQTDEQTYAAKPYATGLARGFTRARLIEWGIGLRTETADAVEQVVSELVANAVLYGGSNVVTLQLEVTATSVLVLVGDASPVTPVMREAHPMAESGRGLAIIRHCADRTWHIHPASGGKILCAEVART